MISALGDYQKNPSETDLENIITFKELIRLDNSTQNILRPRALKHVYQSNFYNTPITEYLDKDKIELNKVKEAVKIAQGKDFVEEMDGIPTQGQEAYRGAS